MGASRQTLHAVAAVFGLLACTVAMAQAPIKFENSAEAVRLYDLRTLDSLRENCATAKADTLFARKEVTELKNGYALAEVPGDQADYSVYVFNQDTRMFTLVRGQALGRDARIRLRLSLPKDYGRCRIVRGANGSEQLEIIYQERNAVQDVTLFQKMTAEAVSFAADNVAKPLQCAPGTPAVTDRIVAAGAAQPSPVCGDAWQALQGRMARTLHRVLD